MKKTSEKKAAHDELLSKLAAMYRIKDKLRLRVIGKELVYRLDG